MHKISEIISKPIYTIYEGINAGTVINFFYDKRYKRIKGFFVFEDESDVQNQFINIKNIFTIGENYLLIKNRNKIQSAIFDNNNIINLKAVSINGENAGEIIDMYLDDKYYVKSIETNKGIILPVESIVNIGKDIVIFDNSEKKVNIYKMKPVDRILTNNIPHIKVNILDEKTISTIPIISKDLNIPEKINNEKKSIALPPKILSNPKSIIGKYAKELICGLNGEVIVKKGQMITEKIYEKAKKHSKLFELTNNVN